MTSTVFIY